MQATCAKMSMNTVFVNVLTGQMAVAAMHSKRVVPDDSGHVDLLVQVLISLAGVQPVLVRPSDFHLPFWFAIYCFTTASETEPTVEMNFERVHELGSLLFMNGNSSRMVCAVHPLIFAQPPWLPLLWGQHPK